MENQPQHTPLNSLEDPRIVAILQQDYSYDAFLEQENEPDALWLYAEKVTHGDPQAAQELYKLERQVVEVHKLIIQNANADRLYRDIHGLKNARVMIDVFNDFMRERIDLLLHPDGVGADD